MALTERITRRPCPGRGCEERLVRATFPVGLLRTTFETRSSSRVSRGFPGAHVRGMRFVDPVSSHHLFAART